MTLVPDITRMIARIEDRKEAHGKARGDRVLGEAYRRPGGEGYRSTADKAGDVLAKGRRPCNRAPRSLCHKERNGPTWGTCRPRCDNVPGQGAVAGIRPRPDRSTRGSAIPMLRRCSQFPRQMPQARECARTIAGWQPLRPVKRMSKPPRLRRVR